MGAPDLEQDFAGKLAAVLPDPLPQVLGVAVSGGSDSTALMHLAAHWARARGIALRVVTIDHGLRAAAAAEAAQVAKQASALTLSHDVIKWTGWDKTGNLQDAARQARRHMIADWRGEISHVLMGHTQDDQAETVLMHLNRGSGVDGLAGIAPIASVPDARGGYHLARPLLDVRRKTLRRYLEALGIAWSDDPSNEDFRYERVRLRHALAAGEAGLSVSVLAETGRRMMRARRALERRATEAATAIAKVEFGDVLLERAGLDSLDNETQLRVLSGALQWVSSAPYKPREAALMATLKAAKDGTHGALHGCLLRVSTDRIRVMREWKSVADVNGTLGPANLWDQRWTLIGEAPAAAVVKAVGEAGYSQIDAMPKSRPPHQSILSQPGVWLDNRLISVPLLQWGLEIDCLLRPIRGEFASSFFAD